MLNLQLCDSEIIENLIALTHMQVRRLLCLLSSSVNNVQYVCSFINTNILRLFTLGSILVVPSLDS